MNRKSLGLIAFIITLHGQSYGQELISSSGTSFVVPSAQLDWSIGEVVITTEVNVGYSITQGFHQPLANTSGLAFLNGDDGIQVYPNPATQELFVKAPGIHSSAIEVYDNLGEVIFSGTIKNEFARIDLSLVASGMYFLRINQSNNITTKFYKL